MVNVLNKFERYSLLIFSILVLGFVSIVNAEQVTESKISSVDALAIAIEKVIEEHQAPAMSIGVIENGETVWLKTFGQADLGNNIAANDQTLFRIGSVSKMFIALSVLQLVEQGKLNLQDKLTDLAPEIVFDNPWQESHPIRLVHLLEHTTGWPDLTVAEYGYSAAADLTLGKALMLFPDTRTSRWVPGTRHAYSSVGSAVAARIIEKITGKTFEDYVQQNWFDRLNMATTTFFQPDNAILATSYMQQQEQPYWDIIYRPAGAINSTAHEMLNLVYLLLQRGQFEQNDLLPKQAIDRMEIPMSNLGAEVGIKHGYGLANYTSGYHHVTFHGHNGAVNGATSELAYAPQLNSGYVILTTGVSPAQHLVGKKIKQYLIRDQQVPIKEKSTLDQSFIGIDGYYKPINLRNTNMALMADSLMVKKVFIEDNTFKTEPLITGYPSSAYQINVGNSSNALIDEWVGLPAVAVVNDPLVGEAIQMGTDLYVKESGWIIGGKLGILAATLLITLLSLLYGLGWSIKYWRKKHLQPHKLTIRKWPTYTALSLVAYLICGIVLSGIVGLEGLSKISLISVLIYITSLLYPLIAVWGCYKLVIAKAACQNSRGYWVAVSVSALHILAVGLLFSYEQLAVKTWLM